MTLLLISVAGPDDAAIALARGADIVDVRADPAAVRAMAQAVGGRKPVSAAAGAPAMQPDALVAATAAMVDAGADYVRVSLFEGPGRADCVRALSSLARRTKLIGVMFADAGADLELIAPMAESGFAGAMLDVARKERRHLLDHIDIATLGGFVDAVHKHGMLAGLAGALEAPDVPRLLLLAPDILGVGPYRPARIEAAIDMIRALIPRRRVSEKLAKAEHRALAPRAHGAPTDRIFVHDFVLPVSIGSYARERDTPQSVRFNVDVEVLRPEHAPADMRDVFSYDVITDSIRMVAVREHVALVEMVAERVAAIVLTHPRVVSVTVRVEKLDVGPGSVGVEIVRARAAEAANVHQLFPLVAETDPKAAR